MKAYKTERGARIAAGKLGYKVYRRNKKGQFSKRGKQWTVGRAPKRKAPVQPPTPPPKERTWHIKIDYSKSKDRPVVIDAIVISRKPLSRNEAETVFRNAVNGIPPRRGIRIDAIQWGRKGRVKQGSTADLNKFTALIDSSAEFRVERQE